jgi:NAD(P)-dependent dehydrogenase (short-subunit alcohol dehydrogenase family)
VKLAIVTGASQGIGAGVADAFARAGYALVGISRSIAPKPMDDPAKYDDMAAFHPIGRAGAIGDVVHGILHLERATLVTGEILHIDGGQAPGH